MNFINLGRENIIRTIASALNLKIIKLREAWSVSVTRDEVGWVVCADFKTIAIREDDLATEELVGIDFVVRR